MKRSILTGLIVFHFVLLAAPNAFSLWEETQLTFDTDRNHQLDNNLNWSPDCRWIAYDTRAFSGGIGNTLTLEKVNIVSQEIVTMYTAPNPNPTNGFGPGTSAVSFFPAGDTVIAIRGIDDVQYAGTARFGAMVSPTDGSAGSSDYVISDARDVTEPFTPGALRGGTHRHEPSGDGQWVGFTYNDKIMEGLGKNLRTIGVTKLGIPVDVDDALGNQDGVGFTVLVVKVKPQAEITPGSDDIFQGSEDAWVGEKGYQKADGTWQRARAFIGKTVTSAGGARNEVYIVDIPEDITVAGPDGPLEGTATTFPMPPLGTVQRRLTWSDTDCGGIIRCSLDGSRIAFTRGGQIWLISPLGGDAVQATSLSAGATKPWWDPSGDYIYCVSDNSIWRTNVMAGDPQFGVSERITDASLYPGSSPDALCVAPNGRWVAFNRKVPRPDGVSVNQIFIAAAPATEETRLTFDTDRNHQLDNNLNWSPDCRWIAYDTRAFSGGIGNTLTLEKVNIVSQEIVTMYTAPNPNPTNGFGPGTSAVSFFPAGDTVIAIRGIDDVQYAGTARFGAMVSPTDGSAGSSDYVISDARDVTEPFTPGALRGGTHRHEPSGDGQWVGFTYNDKIMEGLGKNLRTIGVTKLGIPVDVDDALGNQDGVGFTVLVVKVKPQAEITPGSDDIFQGSEDAWVGEKGYQKADGTWQRARAFIGKTVTSAGGARNEVYIVDIPEDITVAGPDGPLEGTATTFPMPPLGTVQRRLTWSDTDCGGIIRCSLDGSRIAFTRGGQIWLISPLGGDAVQATSLSAGATKPWWDPSGDYIYCVSDNSIWRTNVMAGDPQFGVSERITDASLYPGSSPDALCVAPNGQWVAFNRKVNRADGVSVNQIFIVPIPLP
ncbi:MAG: DUF3748 domain-containing protein [Phycisphaerae bacterium]|nr:DUF3748 domain-containing protein [Phycisphaerae bacterium]